MNRRKMWIELMIEKSFMAQCLITASSIVAVILIMAMLWYSLFATLLQVR